MALLVTFENKFP